MINQPAKAFRSCSASSVGEGTDAGTFRLAIPLLLTLSAGLCYTCAYTKNISRQFQKQQTDRQSSATLGMTTPHAVSEGPAKRSLLDEFSLTKESKKIKETVVKS
nr:hypothetical protein Iba_chr02aCG3360 [Ipomoea batatas]